MEDPRFSRVSPGPGCEKLPTVLRLSQPLRRKRLWRFRLRSAAGSGCPSGGARSGVRKGPGAVAGRGPGAVESRRLARTA
ncbi:hypothetical protein GCM10023079_21480 [Streptomyces chitinivorans]